MKFSRLNKSIYLKPNINVGAEDKHWPDSGIRCCYPKYAQSATWAEEFHTTLNRWPAATTVHAQVHSPLRLSYFKRLQLFWCAALETCAWT